MECRICKSTNESLEYVRCDNCPVSICENCDNTSSFMHADDSVIRCSLCWKLQQMRFEIERERAMLSGDFSHQNGNQASDAGQDEHPNPQTPLPESYTQNATPDVPNRPILIIQELIRSQQTEETQ